MPVLSVNNLSKTFTTGFWPLSTIKTYTAVNNISFAIQKGEILGFLGHNGAGKTTTIQMLLGTLTPTSGAITYFDTNFENNRAQILKRVSYASGYDKLPARLTVWENLDIVGRIYCLPKKTRETQIEHLLKFFDMWNMRNKETGSLSAGQATRVTLAKAFLPDPEIVLLDEPTAALDPEAAHDVRKFILKQKQEHNVSVLLTSHNMDEVTQVCDRVLVLKNGEIIANNTPDQLANSVASARVRLMLKAGHEQLITYLQEQNLPYKQEEHSIEIDIDEDAIAHFLAQIGKRDVIYSQISIDTPTLEDYFLHLAKK